MNISIFPQIKEVKGGKSIRIDKFLDDIRDGRWQDQALPIRLIQREDDRREAKSKLPYVTLSGTFSERNDSSILEHSGFIGIDIDNIDPEEAKSILCPDKHVYAAFTSVSGKGLCVIMKIDGKKHRESFAGISEYLFTKYQIIVDPTSINVSRPRYVSYDPHIYTNPQAAKFTALKKEQKEKPEPQIVFVQSDFEAIVNEISTRGLDITGDYHVWLRVGFAIANKFGDAGRKYFHLVSEPSTLYLPESCDRQYTNCVKAGKHGITIATFYYLAKKAGIQTMSEQTKTIAKVAQNGKKGKIAKADVIKMLEELESIPVEISEPIISQIFNSSIQIQSEDSLIEDLRTWLKFEYDIKRNEITRHIEVDGKIMDDIVFNDVFCQGKIVFDKLNAELLTRVLYSSATQSYNPLLNYFRERVQKKPTGVIREFFSCITSDTGSQGGEFFPDYVYHFGVRWLVGIIASTHGQHSPLMLVLTGRQGNGKTEFFRRLLPAALQLFFAESKMDRDKDDDILMCKKLLIYDDEMSGKSKKEEKRLKELLSKDTITVREPYGKFAIDMKRLAVFCGTTNDMAILNDPTGNRRIIPIHVISIDFERINDIDREALFMEAYHLYKSGFQWQLTSGDTKILNENTSYFEQPSAEYELLMRYFEPPTPAHKGEFFTHTEIKSILEVSSQQKVAGNKLGSELRKVVGDRISKRDGDFVLKGYYLKRRL